MPYVSLWYNYADNLVLLAPSVNAMRSMSHACDIYATQYYILLNANKSKGICCISYRCVQACFAHVLISASFFVGLQPIHFVKIWPHLGPIISHSCDGSDDLCAKKTKSYRTSE